MDSVQSFVSQNARRLLNLTEAFVWPVSARRALDAKLALGNSSFGGLYPANASSSLESDERWQSSRFSEMEAFVADFFSGTDGAASAESVRLKFQTPLYVADALLDASRRQLKNERFAAEKDVAAAQAVSVQLSQFESDMRRDGRIQQQSAKKIIQQVVISSRAYLSEICRSRPSPVPRHLWMRHCSCRISSHCVGISQRRREILNCDHRFWRVDSEDALWEPSYPTFAISSINRLPGSRRTAPIRRDPNTNRHPLTSTRVV